MALRPTGILVLILLPSLLLLLAPAAPGAAPVVLDVRTERIESADWRIFGLAATVQLADEGLSGRLRIARIEVPGAGLDLADTAVECGRVLLSGSWFRCHDATLDADFPLVGRQRVAARFDYERATGETRFELPGLALASGSLGLIGRTGESGTLVDYRGSGLALDGLVELANALGKGPGELSTAGKVDVSGRLQSGSGGELQVELDATLVDASVANEAGTLVGEALRGALELDLASDADGWRFDLALAADSGEAYVEPVYANFAEHAFSLRAADVHTQSFESFDVEHFELEQASRVSLGGAVRFTLPEGETPLFVESATIDIEDTAVEALYANLLQIALAGTLAGDLETAGSVSGRVTLANGAPASARLELSDVILDDRRRRFAIYGLSGSLNWPGPAGEAGSVAPSELRWSSGNLRGILFDGAEAALDIGNDDIVLREPLRLPTMGGALRINRLEVYDYGLDSARGLLDAELEPIQLGQLTGAFGWPAFSGSLSGRLPLLQYDGNAMTVGGSLTANAFDGDIEFSNLRIVQPFGRVPRLSGDLTLRRLDLERVTNTFSFGLIQGRLSGDVSGLNLVAWRPVAMDMHLYSAPGDRTPRRISQRAVENLASVGGGGAGAVLSSGLLSFFEVFAYERIGLRCVLDDGVCRMSGAGPAGEGPLGRGYYIVKGRGIPRIDVIGYRERVGWEALLQQLSTITRDTAPVVN